MGSNKIKAIFLNIFYFKKCSRKDFLILFNSIYFSNNLQISNTILFDTLQCVIEDKHIFSNTSYSQDLIILDHKKEIGSKMNRFYGFITIFFPNLPCNSRLKIVSHMASDPLRFKSSAVTSSKPSSEHVFDVRTSTASFKRSDLMIFLLKRKTKLYLIKFHSLDNDVKFIYFVMAN